MRLRHRVREAEKRAGIGADVTISIVWDGRGEEPWRERVEEARRRRWGIRLIRIGLMDHVDSVEEAEARVARHRDEGGRIPITVYRKGTQGAEVLAEWDPGLPAWLRDDDEAVDEEKTDVA